MNQLSKIKDEELTWVLTQKGTEQAILEHEWVKLFYGRKIVLAELAKLSTESSQAGADREARASIEYKAHIDKMGEVKEKLIIARVKHEAVGFEIKTRLNKQFQDRAEFKGGGLNT